MGTYINNLKDMLANLKLDIITGMSNFTGYTYGADDMTLGTMNAFMGATDDTFGGYTNLLNDGSAFSLLYYDKSFVFRWFYSCSGNSGCTFSSDFCQNDKRMAQSR